MSHLLREGSIYINYLKFFIKGYVFPLPHAFIQSSIYISMDSFTSKAHIRVTQAIISFVLSSK